MSPAAAGKIDVHTHSIPPFLAEAATKAGRGASISRGFPDWTPALALAFMAENGISRSYLSISQPGVHFGDDAAARDLARRCNDHFAALIESHPGRFGAFAALPLPDVDAALAEAERALDGLKLAGVGLLASYGTAFLGDPEFDPLLALLDERGAVAFVHPNYHSSSRGLGMAIPGFLVEFPIDTTRAVANLIFGGALERFPRIRFVLAHNGGAVPYLGWRLAMAPLIDQRFQSFSRESILAALQRFYYETAQAAGPATMAALGEIADPSRLLYGTDWPYCPPAVARAGDEALAAGQAPTALDAILRGNAARLFGHA
ncbi:MAG TPA: amidohydrolase family protein [Hyphomicrobiales bacterium]|nr:amidohydrolase family protein [Hyphomicrobiales bacterium]